ncbi:MAG: phospho-sugar mutase [Oscillospiraceae bacterium]|nr:phospho-sugar mutase [Oscillospiraceae bacterium]
MYRAEYEKWRSAPVLSAAEQMELAAIAGDEKEIEERFFGPLAFGTAGLRGIMGVGLARMNVHVIRHATQAFAQVILDEGQGAADAGVILCYDCRHQSDVFAKEAAAVMAANGIRVRLFDGMRPTPQLSFAIRYYGATGGVNITASHNPPAYNGYKVYWSDGAQLPPRHAAMIAEQMAQTDIFADIQTMDFDEAVVQGRITLLGEETDELFLARVLEQSVDNGSVAQVADRLKVVYTPFHGTGATFVPEAIRRLGVKHVLPVAAQMVPDGDFSTVVSPNPEDPAGFALSLDLARAENADVIIGTDPDADRVGCLVRHGDDYQMISGNQMGVLLLGYLITAKKAAGTLPANAATIKSIVTTEMARDLAERHGVAVYDTFTGFKFMAEKIIELGGSKQVIFSYEESYGYMIGDFIRDKDGVTTSMLIAEMAAWYKTRDMTLVDGVEEYYRELGTYYGEETLNLVMPGLDGMKNMARLMETLRTDPPTEIGGQAVAARWDYLIGKRIADGVETDIAPSGSNVLGFTLADGTNFMVRPSGTEPKVKVYILAKAEDRGTCERTIARCVEYAERLADSK